MRDRYARELKIDGSVPAARHIVGRDGQQRPLLKALAPEPNLF